MERALMIKTPSGEKIVGKILMFNGEPIFYREVNKSNHAFRRFEEQIRNYINSQKER